MTKTQKILVGVLIFAVVVLLARFVFFKEKFDKWGENLQNLDSWQQNYKKENPNATKADMDADFDSSMSDLKEWQDDYKKEHPDATDVEIDAAFNAAWGK